MTCELRLQLAEAFAITARLYAEIAVNFVCDVSQEDYIRLCRRVEEAQERSEAAYAAYEEHLICIGVGTQHSAGQNTAAGIGGSDN